MCSECKRIVFDPEDLIDGLCSECVDALLFNKTTDHNDIYDSKGRFKKFGERATRRSAPSSLGIGRTQPI